MAHYAHKPVAYRRKLYAMLQSMEPGHVYPTSHLASAAAPDKLKKGMVAAKHHCEAALRCAERAGYLRRQPYRSPDQEILWEITRAGVEKLEHFNSHPSELTVPGFRRNPQGTQP